MELELVLATTTPLEERQLRDLVLHAGDNSRPQVQLAIQEPAADDAAAELELQLELLRDATDVGIP
jgi:hypothetical protein